MAQPNHTPRLAYTEEALTVLFCLSRGRNLLRRSQVPNSANFALETEFSPGLRQEFIAAW
jgi:hypothetical protein